MIKHIVIFKLTPPYTAEEKEKSVRKLKEIFGPLGKSLITSLNTGQGSNILEADHAGDFVIDPNFQLAGRPEPVHSQRSSTAQAVAEASVIRKRRLQLIILI